MYFLNFIPGNSTVLTFADETQLERWLQNCDVYTRQGIFAYNHFCKFMLAMHPNECSGEIIVKPQIGLRTDGTYGYTKEEKQYGPTWFKRFSSKVQSGDTAQAHKVHTFLSKTLGVYVGKTQATDFMLYMRSWIIYDDTGKTYNYMKYIDKRMKELYAPIVMVSNVKSLRYNTYYDSLADAQWWKRYKEMNRYGYVLTKSEQKYLAPYMSTDIEDEDAPYDIYNKPLRGKRRAMKYQTKEPAPELFKDNVTWKRTKKRKQWMHGRKITGNQQGLGKITCYEQYYQKEYGDIVDEEEIDVETDVAV